MKQPTTFPACGSGEARSAALVGVEATPVIVAAHASIGVPGFHVVGLADCTELRDRLSAAFNSGDEHGLPWDFDYIVCAPAGHTLVPIGLDDRRSFETWLANERSETDDAEAPEGS